ncbi:MAG: hypothetical protein AAGF06_02465 [Pseudomonadota bacterium]
MKKILMASGLLVGTQAMALELNTIQQAAELMGHLNVLEEKSKDLPDDVKVLKDRQMELLSDAMPVINKYLENNPELVKSLMSVAQDITKQIEPNMDNIKAQLEHSLKHPPANK